MGSREVDEYGNLVGIEEWVADRCKQKIDVKVVPDGGGLRHNDGKPRVDLLPPDVLLALAEVYTKAIGKYPERNWERGMKWSNVYASLQRHLYAFWAGEDVDPESQQAHIMHALWNVVALATYQIRGIGEDDRNYIIPLEDVG